MLSRTGAPLANAAQHKAITATLASLPIYKSMLGDGSGRSLVCVTSSSRLAPEDIEPAALTPAFLIPGTAAERQTLAKALGVRSLGKAEFCRQGSNPIVVLHPALGAIARACLPSQSEK